MQIILPFLTSKLAKMKSLLWLIVYFLIVSALAGVLPNIVTNILIVIGLVWFASICLKA